MGCTSSMSSVIVNHVGSKTTDKRQEEIFSSRQKQIVRRSWRQLTGDLTERGTRVFLYIFHQKPELKVAFHLDNLDDEELVKNFIFIDHASRFMQAVGAVIENIDSLNETLTPLLTKLGATHVGFDGFEVTDLPLFVESIMSVWESDIGQTKFTLEVRDAWLKVFVYITGTLELGYTNNLTKET